MLMMNGMSASSVIFKSVIELRSLRRPSTKVSVVQVPVAI